MGSAGVIAGVIVGVAVGAVLTYVLAVRAGRREQERAAKKAVAEFGSLVDQLKTEFAALSSDALSKNTDEFLKLAKTRLEGQTVAGSEQLESKKKLIDAALQTMTIKLTELTNLTQTIDKARHESAGAIKAELARTTDATSKLRETAGHLREALASPQRRGQWGERMADDVLQLAGFVEGVNYEKQARVSSGERPDFTFMLPQGLKLNMDVKFPLDNYLRAMGAGDAAAERGFQTALARDVRNHLKAVTSREYIDPEGGTVDCVLVFIPNEQVYGYLHQHDRALIDDAVKQKIVLCSPLTLYAVLAVIRQAVDNFRMGQTSREILSLLGAFRREWSKYGEVVDRLGKALDQAATQFEALQTTRTRKLERQLDRIDDLRQAKGVAMPSEIETDSLDTEHC